MSIFSVGDTFLYYTLCTLGFRHEGDQYTSSEKNSWILHSTTGTLTPIRLGGTRFGNVLGDGLIEAGLF
jgi:hypothetical protein